MNFLSKARDSAWTVLVSRSFKAHCVGPNHRDTCECPAQGSFTRAVIVALAIYSSSGSGPQSQKL